MAKITVPDIDHATLCYKQKLDPPGAMGRCDRPKGHLGPHSWALADCLRDLDGLEQKMRANREEWLPTKIPGESMLASEHYADRLRAVVAPYRALLQ